MKMPMFFTFIFLFIDTLFSQPNNLDKLLNNNIQNSFSSHGIGMNGKLNRNVYTQNFDSTSVVDSIKIVGDYGGKRRYSYTYDPDWKKTMELVEYWHNYNDWWENWYKISYSYDSNDMIISSIREVWDRGIWLIVDQSTFTYDSIGNMTLQLDKVTGTNSARWIHTYDSDKNKISSLYEQWNENDSLWVSLDQYTYRYDSNRNMISNLHAYLYWDGTKWVNEQTTYSYDSNGNLLLSLLKVEQGNRMEYFSKIIYVYNSIENMIEKRYEVWESNWHNRKREKYTYDSNDNVTIKLSEVWDLGQWNNSDKVTNTYNSKGDMIKALALKWNGSGWKNGDGPLNLYDSFGRFYSFDASWMEVFYNAITEVKEIYLNRLEFNLSQNYPNPFNPSTVLRYDLPQSGAGIGDTRFVSIKIYDVLGKEVAILVNKEQSAGSYEVEFRANGLSSGLYFYRLQVGTSIGTATSFVETKKMILLR